MPWVEVTDCPNCGCGPSGPPPGQCVLCSPPQRVYLYVWVTLFSGHFSNSHRILPVGANNNIFVPIPLDYVPAEDLWRSLPLPDGTRFEWKFLEFSIADDCLDGPTAYCASYVYPVPTPPPAIDVEVTGKMCPFGTTPDPFSAAGWCHSCATSLQGAVHWRGDAPGYVRFGIVIFYHYIIATNPGHVTGPDTGDCCCKQHGILRPRVISARITGCENYTWTERMWVSGPPPDPAWDPDGSDHGLISANPLIWQASHVLDPITFDQRWDTVRIRCLQPSGVIPAQDYYMDFYGTAPPGYGANRLGSAQDVRARTVSCDPLMVNFDVTTACSSSGSSRLVVDLTP